MVIIMLHEANKRIYELNNCQKKRRSQKYNITQYCGRRQFKCGGYMQVCGDFSGGYRWAGCWNKQGYEGIRSDYRR